MALNEYVVDINGHPHTLQLDENDAKRYGSAAKRVENKAAAPAKGKPKQPAAPKNKAAAPAAVKAAPAPAGVEGATDPGSSV